MCMSLFTPHHNFFITFRWISQTLAKEPWVADYDLSSLKCLVSAGAKTDASIIHALHERFGIALINMIAMTEAIGYLSPSWEASMEGTTDDEV